MEIDAMMSTVRPERAQASSATKFRYLLWKNFMIQKRHKWHTILEIFMPVLAFIVLAYIRSKSGQSYAPAIIVGQPTPLDKIDHSGMVLVYTPANQFFTDLMKNVSQTLHLGTPKATNSPAEMEEFLINNNTPYIAGVQFNINTDKSSTRLSYSLRFPAFLYGGTYFNWQTNNLYPSDAFEKPRDYELHGTDRFYEDTGFLAIQNAIAKAYYELNLNEKMPTIKIKPLPYPKYLADAVLNALQFSMPFLFIISFNYAFVNTIRFITIEKEKQLKEFMQMHGLSSWLHWASWLVRTLIMQVVTIITIIILSSWPWFGGTVAVLPRSNPICLFIFFMAYSFSLITLCFLVSSCCSKAKTAATVSSIIWYLTFAPFFWTQQNYDHLSGTIKVLLSLLPNTGFGYGLKLIVRLEEIDTGLQWSTFLTTSSVYENLSIFWIIIILLFDSVLFFMIAIYIENIFPGTYGVSKPWYFPFQRKFWIHRKYRQFETSGCNDEKMDVSDQSPLSFEKEPTDQRAGIEIRELCKKFSADKMVVNKVSMNLYDDHITVLLGHNGAGKSTTIAMLSGMMEATGGTAIINGYDIKEDTASARHSMGFCPQHNVLYDELTVAEHLELFSLLKGATTQEAKSEVRKYVQLLSLEAKANVLSSALSGGMKRKLQMGIAFCADSRVVLVDEATSGLDPAARREMWDILQNEKKGRTILLTTHFMDEADVLGDRIAILVDGMLKCCGTTFFLKKRFGTGYHLICAKEGNCESGAVTDLLRQHIPGIEVTNENENEISYHLPERYLSVFKDIFMNLERNDKQLGLDSFGISLTTMEEIFLQMGKNNPTGDQTDGSSSGESRILLRDDDYFLTGMPLWINQFKAMLTKRSLYWMRSWKSFVGYNLFVLFVVSLLLFPIDVYFKKSNLPPLHMSLDSYKSPRIIVDHSNNNTVISQYTNYIKQSSKANIVSLPNSAISRDMEILKLASDSTEAYSSRYIAGISNLGDESILVWFNNQMYHSSALALNLLHNALFDSKFSIDVTNAPLKFPITSKQIPKNEDLGAFFAVIIGISLSFYASTFIMFYIQEKECRSKFLQYVSGMNIFIFWGTSVIWDILIFIPTVILIIVLCAVSHTEGLSTFGVLGPLTLLLILFQFANSTFLSIASLIFSKPTTGNTVISSANMILLILHATNTTMQFLPEAIAFILRAYPLNSFCGAVYRLAQYNLIKKTCTEICSKIDCSSTQFCESQPQCCASLFSWKHGIGIDTVYMILGGITLHLLLVVIEMGLLSRYVAFVLNHLPWNIPKKQETVDEPIDDDVQAEKALISVMPLGQLKQETVVLQNVSKYYGRFVAVNDVSFLVKRAECFGLLGNNGAGKTSIFKMLTGEEHISRGEIYLAGYNQKTELHNIFKNIGYCPQFDALLDELTCRETLEIFSLIRGISQADTRLHTLNAARSLDFLKHIDKKVRELSGGNKRKLSTALSLIGNPDIVLLDEPTTGMDPATKRNLWNVIIALRESGKSIVLTSHSMEECEALCTNLTVMVNGKLKCLGSTQHLKNKFTKGFELKIKVKQNAQGIMNLMEIKNFVLQTFAGAILKEEYQGLLSYSVAMTNFKWSHLFGVMENAKSDYQIEDYSINQTSLEQVVLSLVRNQISTEK